MNGDSSLLIGLVVYLLVMLAVGVRASRRVKRLDDFLLGGRRVGALAASISERASGESAWFLLGLPGAAYAVGFTEFWSVIGIAAGIFASWTLLALPLRKATAEHGALTIPDYFEARFNDRSRLLRTVSMIIIVIFYTAYLAAQFVGGSKILAATFGIEPMTGLLISVLVVTFYTCMGGFLAVVWTDVIQGFLMAAIAILLPAIGIAKLGGLGGFAGAVAARGPDFLSMTGGKTGAAFVFGVMLGSLSWGLGYLGQPHLLARYMAARGPREIRNGTKIAVGWVLAAYWGAPLIGLVGIGILGPDLADPETVMPLLTKTLLPGWIAGIFISAAIAAMMSTADSQLIVVTSAVVEDFYVRILRRGGERPGHLVLASRLATILIALVAFFLAVSSRDFIYDMVSYAWAGLGASFGPPLLLSLRWKETTRWGVLAGMLAGTFSNIVWKNMPAWNEALDLKIASFLFSLAFTVAVSVATRGPESPREGNRQRA
ncbi:MAG: sodium/proline symporter [Candidatus Eisenbacteria bacterium]